MSFIRRAWRGEEKLWKVFWLYGFLGGYILYILKYIFFLPSYGHSFFKHDAELLYLFFDTCFGIWITISIWRCAFNAERRFWGYVARMIVFAPILFFIMFTALEIAVSYGKSYFVNGFCESELNKKADSLRIERKKYYADHSEEFAVCVIKFNKEINGAFEKGFNE